MVDHLQQFFHFYFFFIEKQISKGIERHVSVPKGWGLSFLTVIKLEQDINSLYDLIHSYKFELCAK